MKKTIKMKDLKNLIREELRYGKAESINSRFSTLDDLLNKISADGRSGSGELEMAKNELLMLKEEVNNIIQENIKLDKIVSDMEEKSILDSGFSGY